MVAEHLREASLLYARHYRRAGFPNMVDCFQNNVLDFLVSVYSFSHASVDLTYYPTDGQTAVYPLQGCRNLMANASTKIPTVHDATLPVVFRHRPAVHTSLASLYLVTIVSTTPPSTTWAKLKKQLLTSIAFRRRIC